MITYGGIPLAQLSDQSVSSLVNRFINVDNLEDLAQPVWTGLDENWDVPEFGPTHTVEIGRLYWPRTASKFAIGRFVATETQLIQIRQLAYSQNTSEQGLLPLDLVVWNDNAANAITASMYMIPPRPLLQWDGVGVSDPDTSKNLYLLTLVDARYWWWRASLDITITTGMTWAQLYTRIGTAIGVTIQADPVDSAYLKPPQDLRNRYKFIPPFLDAVAASCGQRIIRDLDGTVSAQNVSTAVAANEALKLSLTAKVQAGGNFRFAPGSLNDIRTEVPAYVRTVFPIHYTSDPDVSDPCSPDRCGADPYVVTTSLSSLNLAAFNGVRALVGLKTFHSTATAWYSGTTIDATSQAQVEALAAKLASDWYSWQIAGDQNRMIPGIVGWTGEAANDYVEWQSFPTMETRVVRETMNDLAGYLFNESTRPGLLPNTSVRLATAEGVNLTGTYADGPDATKPGVGATFTVVGTATVDNIAVVVDDLVLLKDQTVPAQNGLYICTLVGVNTVLTRHKKHDEPHEFVGQVYNVRHDGDTNRDTEWRCTNLTQPTVGTTAITIAPLNFIRGVSAHGPTAGHLRAASEPTDSVAGNARGQGAVELQQKRASAGQVASGNYSTIGGGLSNTASGAYSTIGGGDTGIASGSYSTVAGGYTCKASGDSSSVVGGDTVWATDSYATAVGGKNNTASAAYASIVGGNNNAASTIYATIGGGTGNTASGSASFIGGGTSNTSAGANSAVAGGSSNQSSGATSFVGGGGTNVASGANAAIGGGSGNTASGTYTGVLGGQNHSLVGNHSMIGGGYGHSIPSTYTYSGIGSGQANQVSGTHGFIGGGYTNGISANYCFIGGGYGHTASAVYAAVGGGIRNAAGGESSSIMGGSDNAANGDYSLAGGGQANVASAAHATAGGGKNNTASAAFSLVVGGEYNYAASVGSVVGGGAANNTTTAVTAVSDAGAITGTPAAGTVGVFSFVGGGRMNRATATDATISGGIANTASGPQSALAGGSANTTSGSYSSMIGGAGNTASGSYSVIGGGASNVASGAGAAVVAGASNVSSAEGAFIGNGNTNTVSAIQSHIVSGTDCTVSGQYAAASGQRAKARLRGQRTHSGMSFSQDAAGVNSNQQSEYLLLGLTTDATPVEMTTDFTAEKLTIPSGVAMAGTIEVFGLKSDGSKSCHYRRQFTVKNVGGTTTLPELATIGTDFEDDASYDVTITGDDAGDYLKILVTGKSGETLRWSAHVSCIEIKYGT